MISLEDTFHDILGKAQRGLHLSDSEIADKAHISISAWQNIKQGRWDETIVRKVAPVLKLRTNPLIAIGKGEWKPKSIANLSGLLSFNTVFGNMTVNSYLIWDPASREAVVFDTGADCRPILQAIEKNYLHIHFIFLTHTHSDHIADLDRLHSVTKAPVYVSEKEPIPQAHLFTEGKVFHLGQLTIQTRLTSGHSVGGTTYFITGLAYPVAVVGDALFAGSMGGGLVSYTDAIKNNREKILTLPDNTILCPGHGPTTTINEEKQCNPFF